MILTNLLRFVSITCLAIFGEGHSWRDLIPEGYHLIFPLVVFIINLLALAGVVYIAGLIVVGRKRALFRDAFVIALLGTVLSTLFFMFISYPFLALALSIIVWLLLVKSLYETGWLGAIAVSIMTVIVYLAITVILALIFGIITEVWRLVFPSFTNLFWSV